MENLLTIQNLYTEYATDHGLVQAVNGVSLTIGRGETLGLVGETGAGKTTTALSILKLIQSPPGRIKSGKIFLGDQELTVCSDKEMQKIRGKRLSMIFQDPMTALNPVITVGNQIAEVIRLHEKCSRAEAEVRASEMLEMVGIPAERFREYPHQFSGGMKQRVVIAIALACIVNVIEGLQRDCGLGIPGNIGVEQQLLPVAPLYQHTHGAKESEFYRHSFPPHCRIRRRIELSFFRLVKT